MKVAKQLFKLLTAVFKNFCFKKKTAIFQKLLFHLKKKQLNSYFGHFFWTPPSPHLLQNPFSRTKYMFTKPDLEHKKCQKDVIGYYRVGLLIGNWFQISIYRQFENSRYRKKKTNDISAIENGFDISIYRYIGNSSESSHHNVPWYY